MDELSVKYFKVKKKIFYFTQSSNSVPPNVYSSRPSVFIVRWSRNKKKKIKKTELNRIKLILLTKNVKGMRGKTVMLILNCDRFLTTYDNSTKRSLFTSYDITVNSK